MELARGQLFKIYSAQVVNDFQMVTLDDYLKIYGFQLHPMHSGQNEGYITDTQKQQFQEQLALYPNIKSILEIGLNGGHSAETFFRNCKELERFLSFDIDRHPYTRVAVEYFKRWARERFIFVKGDSLVEVPKYASTHPEEKYDLIYIDGNHDTEYCLKDILNCKQFAHEDTLLWVDDYNAPWLHELIDQLAVEGVIAIEQIFSSWGDGGQRAWVQLRYL